MESPKRRQPEIPPLQSITCPPDVRFHRVLKDTHTNGRIYGVYHNRRRDAVWLGQSLYGVVQEINKLRRYERMHSSTAYRVLRGQAEFLLMGMIVERLRDAEHVNELLDRIDAPSVVVVTRDPDKWELAAFRKGKVD